MVELAIFGGITLLALGSLIRLGMNLNYQQQIRIAATRRANETGQLVHYIRYRRMPNPSDPLLLMPHVRTEATGIPARRIGVSTSTTIVHADGAERAVPLTDFEDLFRQGIVKGVRTTVEQRGTFTQAASGSGGWATAVTSQTSTTADTVLNTKNRDTVTSRVSGSTAIQW